MPDPTIGSWELTIDMQLLSCRFYNLLWSIFGPTTDLVVMLIGFIGICYGLAMIYQEHKTTNEAKQEE